MNELRRIAIKIFVEEGNPVRPAEVIPVFHRWIQTKAVGELLIDVADYTHVERGPGVLLIAHEAHYALDESQGRLGLLYVRKQPLSGRLPERLLASTRLALAACRRLEKEPELAGRIRFRTDELLVVANDRLQAPNDEATLQRMLPELEAFASALYGSSRHVIEADRRPGSRFAVSVRSPAGTASRVDDLLERNAA